jgi:hypothetical protein
VVAYVVDHEFGHFARQDAVIARREAWAGGKKTGTSREAPVGLTVRRN